MNFVASALLGLAILAAQVLHGGLLDPAFSILSAGLLTLAGLSALVAAVRNPVPSAPAALVCVGLFIGYVSWRCAHGPDAFQSRIELGQAWMGAMAFLIAYGGLTTTGSRLTVLGVLGFAASVQAGFGFLQFAQGGFSAPLGWFSENIRSIYEDRFPTRALGLFLNPNQFAWLMEWAALFSISLACWARTSVIGRFILGYLALVFIGALILSGSRGGMLSLGTGVVVFAVISVSAVSTMARRGRWPVILTSVGVVALGVAVAGIIYSSTWVSQARVDAMRVVGDVRAPFLEQGFREFQSAPLFGQGPGEFLYAARLYRTGIQANDAVFAHDDWLQTLGDYGFMGLALAVLAMAILMGGGIVRFFGLVKHHCRQHDRPQSNTAAILIGGISATTAFCAHSFVDFNMHVPANALLAAATLGLLAGTGGQATPRRAVSVGLLRGITGLGLAGIAVALGAFTWRHAFADYLSLRAQNALFGGEVWSVLDDTGAGLAWEENHAGLLATRAQALYSYQSAIQIDKDSDAAKSDPATIDRIRGWTPRKRAEVFQEAAECYKAAIRSQPRERSHYLGLAKCLTELRRPKAVNFEFVNAIARDPAHVFVYGNYSEILRDEGQFMRAVRILEVGRSLSGGGDFDDQWEQLQGELNPPPEEIDEVDTESSAESP